MEFAISPALEGDYRLVVIHAPPPDVGCTEDTHGEMQHPTLVACLNHTSDITTQLQRELPAPMRICDHTGKPVYRHDGSEGGGRTPPPQELQPPTLSGFLTMLAGGLVALDELGRGQRQMHLVLSAGAKLPEPQPAALLAQQFAADLARMELPATVAVTVWLVRPWPGARHNTPKTDAYCRQLQQQVLAQFSWTEAERTPHKKKTYHGLLDCEKNAAELFYEGDMLRSLATAETCPLELLLLRHLPSNKIRMRLAPSTAYVGQVLVGLPPASLMPVETELWLELEGAALAPDLTASIPLPLHPCPVQLCSTPADRASGQGQQHNYRLTQTPKEAPARFAILARNPYLVPLTVACNNRKVTERPWEELDGTPLAKLQQASLGHLHLQHSLLLPTHTFAEAQPALALLWALPADLPNVSDQRTAEVLQQHLLQLRARLCRAFTDHVHGPAPPVPLPVPHLTRQMSCFR